MTNHESVLDAIAGIARLSTELMPLAAIWLERSLLMEGKRSIRIAAGDKVRIQGYVSFPPYLADVYTDRPATHVITECRGTLYSTLLEIDVKDLKTGEILTIKL